MTHSLQLLLLLALIIAAAKLAGALANRIGQPAVFGEILVGLLLGPTLLNMLGWPLFAPPAPEVEPGAGLLAAVRDFAEIGVLLLMFVAGLETDVDERAASDALHSGRRSVAWCFRWPAAWQRRPPSACQSSGKASSSVRSSRRPASASRRKRSSSSAHCARAKAPPSSAPQSSTT
jgi:hypothetical protein